MPRCEGRFVTLDETEVEITSEEVQDDQVVVEVDVHRLCGNCGQSAMTASLTFEETIDHTCNPDALRDKALALDLERMPGTGTHVNDAEPAAIVQAILAALGAVYQYDLDGSASAEPSDRYETTGKNGKPIKNPRFQKHYIGADITVPIKCLACEETFDVQGNVEEQASAFSDDEHSS